MTRNTLIAALIAGLAGGLIDILAAFVVFRPATPQQILQTIGAGVLGPPAYQGGLTTAALGLACHFAISILFGGLYILGARHAPVLLGKPLLGGVTFGVFVYGVMTAIVVPLSLAPERPDPTPMTLGLALFANILFGIAVALVAARLVRTPQA